MDYDYRLKRRGRKRFRCDETDDEDSKNDESEVKENEEKKKKPKFGTKLLGLDKSLSVSSVGNHIYYYSSVNKKSALSLNKEIKSVTSELINNSRKYGTQPLPIYLHINSYGGSVFAALSVIDTIKNNKLPIYSIIEGGSASAATLISVVCDKRFITENAYMLIHQLASVFWGQMDEIEDEVQNLKELMKVIKKVYMDNTKIDSDKLDEILKHDLWWNARKCRSVGLVDKIITPSKKLRVNIAEPF